ncbi:hypothetical protein SK128_026897 [Halocaridina rubra]|uniref:Uncharacterized protein n=1 Tax=Halocaridina rubra TaxID=373956 RepID=A0AAN9ADE4_HALRR
MISDNILYLWPNCGPFSPPPVSATRIHRYVAGDSSSDVDDKNPCHSSTLPVVSTTVRLYLFDLNKISSDICPSLSLSSFLKREIWKMKRRKLQNTKQKIHFCKSNYSLTVTHT